jgi:hypothetical protein
MVPVGILTPLLLAATALWALVAVFVLVDRARYDAHTGRLDRARKELARTNPSLEEHARDVARRIGPTAFQELVLEGLPHDVETALARQVRARAGEDRLRRRADGSESRGVWGRIEALQVLASSGAADAYPALDSAVRSGKPQLAVAAIRMLTRLGGREAAVVLIKALRDGAYSRARLAAAIDRLPALHADLLTPLFESAEPSVRFWGARLAGRFRAREWTPSVRRLVKDGSPLVRRGAVEALAAIGDAADRHLLLARLDDPTAFVRAHAARAIATSADESAADALVTLLADREWIVRASARRALRSIGRPAIAPLIRAMSNADRFAANSAAEVLYANGTITDLARQVLMTPTIAFEATPILQRYMAVAGSHLAQALLSGFTDGERVTLMRYLDARTATT